MGLGPLSSPGVTSLEQPIARFPPGAAFGSDGQEETVSPLRLWSHLVWPWASVSLSTPWGLEAGALGLTLHGSPNPGLQLASQPPRRPSLGVAATALSGHLENIQRQRPAPWFSLSWTFDHRTVSSDTWAGRLHSCPLSEGVDLQSSSCPGALNKLRHLGFGSDDRWAPEPRQSLLCRHLVAILQREHSASLHHSPQERRVGHRQDPSPALHPSYLGLA